MSFRIIVECEDSGTRNVGWLEEIAVVDIRVYILKTVIFLLRNTISSKLKVSILTTFQNEAVTFPVVLMFGQQSSENGTC